MIKRNTVQYVVAVLLGTIAFEIAYMAEAYWWHWYSASAGPFDFRFMLWWTALFGTPMFLLGVTVSLVVYRQMLRPMPDTECRCRLCSYILKGLSKLECPECGEAI